MSSPVPIRKDVKTMGFPEALVDVIAGKKITKLEWDNAKTYVVIFNETLCIHHAKDPEKKFHSLLVSEGDLIGEDWIVIKEKS